MKKTVLLIIALTIAFCVSAQSSLPSPGGSVRPGMGNSLPAPGGNTWNNGWGNPWNSGWNNTPPPPPGTWIPSNTPNWQNSGAMNVMACGYDAQGVWRVLPLQVSYNYNGLQYDVEVLNAWNPWTDMWNYGVDVPAVNTSYYLRGNTYNFYAVLSTGTFYFNL